MLPRVCLAALPALLLSACSLDPLFSPAAPGRPLPPPQAPAPGPQAYPRAERAPAPATPAPAPSPAAEPAPPAVIALMQQAESDRRRGDLERAAARLERALRIQPQNAGLWHRLAGIRLEQHQPRLAEELAKKSISLAGGQRDLLRRNWRLIAAARRLNGDPAGARLAEQNAGRY